MRSGQVLDEAFARLPTVVRRAVDGLDAAALRWQPESNTNPIGWLVWHLTRIQDDHVSELAATTQVWLEEEWASRFGLEPGTTATGYGHTAAQVVAVQPQDPGVLLRYLDMVTARTRTFLETVSDGDLDRIVDASWEPPVTMGVRLVSVLDDGLQHAGQAAYLRGLHDRATGSR